MPFCVTCADEDFASIIGGSGSQVCYGKQIQHIYFQRQGGSFFDGSTLSGTPATAGGSFAVQGDWEAKRDAAADDLNKIIAITNLSNSAIGDPANQELTGNDVPGGGTIITEQNFTMPLRLIYLNKTLLEAFIQISCWGKVKLIFQDDKGYLWSGGGDAGASAGVATGIQNVDISYNGMNFPGLGQPLPVNANAIVSWTDTPPIPLSDTPVTFLQTVFAA